MSASRVGERSTKAYMSIGEVLKDLSQEFTDITISKIRFLETEGLIEPERTPSGYRKFYPNDVARLRYILRLQRDHFMPLKVIRKRMEHFDPSEGAEVIAPQAPASKEEAVAVSVPVQSEDEDFGTFDGGLSMTLAQLASSSGLDEDRIQELEEFGLVDSHRLDDGDVYYDEDDLVAAKLSKDFAKYGIHARHLRMYKNFADKESALFQQVLVPLSRGGEGGRQAAQSMMELAKLSKRLKHLLLKSSLRDYLHS
ncbi:MAG: MerR family transcriptional regulator [Actinomycetota bacterium]|nr:MerR family transcriptional regulator [Actinomycetota bacterium]